MYVWFDALTNYLQGPPGYVHLIGKDIVWFHAVIWPAMLMSAGLPLPRKIVCHGFINDDKGLKMSKSWGNVIDPEDMFAKYPADVLRYYLLSEGSFSEDINFDEKRIVQRYNGELAHNLGNLVQRVLPLVVKYCNGVVDKSTTDILNHEVLYKEIANNYEEYNFSKVLGLIFSAFSEINIWLTKKEPWKNPSSEERRNIVSCVVNNFARILIHLEPFMPAVCTEISNRFVLKKEKDCYLVTDGQVSVGEPLFPKL
jgi:methionyl-tRNA synthetase